MLTRAARQSLRRFSTAPAAKAAAAPAAATGYKTVKFVKEDPVAVTQEVPHFSYYEMPDEPVNNPFKTALLSDQIYVPGITGADGSAAGGGADSPLAQYARATSAALPKPDLKFSQLENGLKIVTCDKGGLSSSLGLYCQVGSRYETPDVSGVSHMIEMMAYRSTAHLSHLRTGKTLEVLGVDADCRAGRESIVYRANVLREFFPVAVPLMIGNILFPRLLRWEVDSAHSKVEQYMKQLHGDPDEYVNECLHQTAYFNNTLGLPKQCTENAKAYFDEHTIRQFMVDNLSPERMSFVACNVDHDEFCKWVMRSFADYNAIGNKERKEVGAEGNKARYVGGMNVESTGSGGAGSCHVGIAFEAQGGWSAGAKQNAALNVYQTVLGGTVGGFEKASGTASSRLTKDVLATSNGSVGSVHAFNNTYTDSGLFGVYGALKNPAYAPQYVASVGKVLQATASGVTADEVKRAKNILKNQVMRGTDRAMDLVEDIGRQMVMSGKAMGGASGPANILDANKTAALIDSVTDADVKAAAAMFQKSKPTVVAYGSVGHVPDYDSICATLGAKK